MDLGKVESKNATGESGSDFETEESPRSKSTQLSLINQILKLCPGGQKVVLPIHLIFEQLRDIVKVDEGTFAEVYTGTYKDPNKSNKFIFKLIPMSQNEKVLNTHGAQQSYEEAKHELLVSKVLNTLRNPEGKYFTLGFQEMRSAFVVYGKYPQSLVEAYKEWAKLNVCRWEEPNFDDSQLYLLLEYENVGTEIEGEIFENSRSIYHGLMQIVFALATAEEAFQYEHRDLHFSNILIDFSTNETETFKINGTIYKIPTNGMKFSIIDFNFGRLQYPELEVGSIYFDLNILDFGSRKDGHWEIYKKMKKTKGNSWEDFNPKSNIYWLEYLATTVLKHGRYETSKSDIHVKYLQKLKSFAKSIGTFESLTSFLQSPIAQGFKE